MACCTRGSERIVQFARCAHGRAFLIGPGGPYRETNVYKDDSNTQLTQSITYPTLSSAGQTRLGFFSDTRVESWSGVRAIGGEPGRLKATVSCADWIPVRLRSRARGGVRQPSARLAGARGALARKVLSTRSRPPVGAGMRLLDRCTRAHVASAAVKVAGSAAEARRRTGTHKVRARVL